MSIIVSIILPVYNTGPYLKKCLDSILDQTLTAIEIIIVDDASTDNSPEIIREYRQKESRIRVLTLPENTPGGVGIPVNRGMDMAHGDYIGFVDSDDWVHPGMFETLHTLAEKHDADYVFCDFYRYDERKDRHYPSNDKQNWAPIGRLEGNLTKENKSALLRLSPVPWRKLYRHSFLKKHKLQLPEGDFFFEDTPFHFMVTLKAQRAAYIDMPLYVHRISRPDQTMSGKGEKYFAFITHGITIYRYMEKEGFLDDHIHDYFLFIIHNFFWVWDRLNNRQRKEFFTTLHRFMRKVDREKVNAFLNNEYIMDTVRVESIYNGNYKAYASFMVKCKSKFGFILRGMDYLKTYGIMRFIQKIVQKMGGIKTK
jgi:glycosyltransferase involved in cell wall biosynthesis